VELFSKLQEENWGGRRSARGREAREKEKNSLPEQRTEVDPDTTLLQDLVDHVQVVDDVLSGVDEEAGDDG